MDKTCRVCGMLKKLSEFYKHPDAKDGVFPECKECNIKRARKWNLSHMENKLANGRRFWHRHREKLILKGRVDRDSREYGGNRYAVLDRDNHECIICGMPEKEHLLIWNEELHVDHLDRNRDNNAMDNLQSICIRCHGSRHGKQSKIRSKTNVDVTQPGSRLNH